MGYSAPEEKDLRKLLVLGAETPALQRIVPILKRADFEVDHSHHGEDALALIGYARYDLILVRYPVVGFSLEQFVGAVRQKDGANEASGVLLLAEPEYVKDVGGFLGHGVNRIVSLDAPIDRLLDAIADLLAVAPRRTLRAMIQLELWVEHSGVKVLTVTENVSASGMLVRGATRFPVGSRLRFELIIPGEPQPIQGEVEVARHADRLREQLEGFGARVLSFFGDDKQRLEEFLKRKG
jgi:hypothetical protein